MQDGEKLELVRDSIPSLNKVFIAEYIRCLKGFYAHTLAKIFNALEGMSFYITNMPCSVS